MLVEVEYQIAVTVDGEAGRDVIVVVGEQVAAGEAKGVATGAALQDEVERLLWRRAGDGRRWCVASSDAADRERVRWTWQALLQLDLGDELAAWSLDDVDFVDGHSSSAGAVRGDGALDHDLDRLAPLIAALRVGEPDVHDMRAWLEIGGVEVDRDFAQYNRRGHVDRRRVAIRHDGCANQPRRIECDRCAVLLSSREQ